MVSFVSQILLNSVFFGVCMLTVTREP